MNTDPTRALEEGVRLLQSNDFTNALAALQQAIQQNPQDGRAYGFMGIAYARLGDLNASVWALQEAARLQPQDSTAQYNLAVGLMQAQRTGEAQGALEQALRLNPNNDRAHAALQSLSAAPLTPAPYPQAQPQATAYPAPAYPTPPMPAPAPQPGYAPNAAPAPMPLNVPPPMSLSGEPMPAPAPNYANYSVPSASNMPPPNYAGTAGGMGYAPTGTPAPNMGGMQYAPQPQAQRRVSEPPSAGKRVLRGLGWGAVFGQWWTLWEMISSLLWHSGEHAFIYYVIAILILAPIFAVMGSIMGLVIGAMDAHQDTGAIVGVVFGLIILGLKFFLMQSGTVFLGIFFWVVTGRFIGSNIAMRVQQFVEA